MNLRELRAKSDYIHVPGDCGSSMNVPPAWLDHDRFRRGREFFVSHSASMILAMYCSLATGLSIMNLLLPLVHTKRSDTPRRSLLRYVHTFLHVALWHYEDVWDSNGPAHKSIQLVRQMHNGVADDMNGKHKRKTGKKPLIDPDRSIGERGKPLIDPDRSVGESGKPLIDPDRSVGESGKLYFSQYDMALVQSGFFAAVLMYPRGFGICCTEQELGDYVYFWRGIGYLLGIDDRFNLCDGTYREVYSLCKEIERDLLLPALSDPPDDFHRMLEAYIEGSNLPSKRRLITKEALFAFIADGMGLVRQTLSVSDYLRYLSLKTLVFFIRWCPYFERILNRLICQTVHKQLHLTKDIHVSDTRTN